MTKKEIFDYCAEHGIDARYSGNHERWFFTIGGKSLNMANLRRLRQRFGLGIKQAPSWGVAVLVIAIAMAALACQSKSNVCAEVPMQVVASSNSETSKQRPVKMRVEPETVTESHICGFMTKTGMPCTRRVKDDNGQFCFQHRTAGVNVNKEVNK